LGNRPRGDHPELDKVLRNDVNLAVTRGQGLDRGAGSRRLGNRRAAAPLMGVGGQALDLMASRTSSANSSRQR
jgi:hypothetical protein